MDNHEMKSKVLTVDFAPGIGNLRPCGGSSTDVRAEDRRSAIGVHTEDRQSMSTQKTCSCR